MQIPRIPTVSTFPLPGGGGLVAKRAPVLALSSAPVQAAGTDSQSLGEQGAWAPRMAAVQCVVLKLAELSPSLPFLRTALLWVPHSGALAHAFLLLADGDAGNYLMLALRATVGPDTDYYCDRVSCVFAIVLRYTACVW